MDFLARWLLSLVLVIPLTGFLASVLFRDNDERADNRLVIGSIVVVSLVVGAYFAANHTRPGCELTGGHWVVGSLKSGCLRA